MTDLFPAARTREDFEHVRREDERFRPGVRAICDRLGLGGSAVERFPDGSLPVYAIGDSLVLKVYPPLDIRERDNESAVLRTIEKRLPIPTPTVHAVGELEGWGFLLMDRLRGENLASPWPGIPQGERIKLASSLGEALAVLHSIEGPDLETARVDWPRFVAEQRRSSVERQRQHGLDEHWLAQIPRFLDETPLGDARPGALLHTEVMREHLLVERRPSGWTLTGLFDFEPAMVGAPEYEFVSVGLFFSCGDARLLRRVLLAYGCSEWQLDAALERRLLAYGLLHRYSNLPWYLRRLPPRDDVETLHALAAHWWGLAASRAF